MMADANVQTYGAESSPASVPEPYAIEVEHIVDPVGLHRRRQYFIQRERRSEIFGLLGPTGAGKSTLIRIDDDADPYRWRRSRDCRSRCCERTGGGAKTIGVIPQALTSDLDLTVEENLNIYAKLLRRARERKKALDRRTARGWWILPSGATRRPRRSPAACGGGSRSRAVSCIIRGVFFLDEPTTGLALQARTSMSPAALLNSSKTKTLQSAHRWSCTARLRATYCNSMW